MSLSPHHGRRRRLALLASGVASIALLALGLAFPVWHAGAGGLERGERARAAKEQPRAARGQRDRADQPGKAKATPADAPVVRPPSAEERGAIPVPLDPRAITHSRPSLPPVPSRPAPPVPQTPAERRPPDAATTGTGVALDALKALFRRPAPASTPRGRAAGEIALGARLFSEVKLSADHRMSCATCHDPGQSFADGRRTARGNRGQALPRNTPALWNLATARAFYWDGRSPTLEAQIKDAIEREGEMDATLEAAVVWLTRDPSYVTAFQRVYGDGAVITGETIVQALAAYQRTLVSPETRFDRFIEGDGYALNDRELAGFRLFTGKARCLACHGGWRLTDDNFHDIGLRSTDPGRQAIAGGPERAFKTPSLRETVWTAPYMHDGSLKTLEDVVAHYAGKLDQRPSLAPELKRGVTLSDTERAHLVAFLRTLSSDGSPPRVVDPAGAR